MSSSYYDPTTGEQTTDNVVADMSKLINSYTPDALMEVASKVTDNRLAAMLKGAATAPEAKRKALLFTGILLFTIFLGSIGRKNLI